MAVDDEVITTRLVNVSDPQQEFLNAEVQVMVNAYDKNDPRSVDKMGMGSGTFATLKEGAKRSCVVLTAKHVVCGKAVREKGSQEVTSALRTDEECMSQEHKVTINAGKTKDPKGEGFDFKNLTGRVVALGDYEEGGYAAGDWAVVVVDLPPETKKGPEFPKPVQAAFPKTSNAYRGIKLVSAGYPGYAGSNRVFADWECIMYDVGGSNTNCEVSSGFSGGGVFAKIKGVTKLVGLNSNSNSELTGHQGKTVERSDLSSGIVSFEKEVGGVHGDGAYIKSAMLQIPCSTL